MGNKFIFLQACFHRYFEYMIKKIWPLLSILFFLACTNESEKTVIPKEETNIDYAIDNHSYSNINEINTTHLHLDIKVNFDKKEIIGVARHTMNNKGTKKAIFDIKSMIIDKITLGTEGNEVETTYTIGKSDSIVGKALVVDISENDQYINIYYRTLPEAEAIGWMEPHLTEDGLYPFLYTQGEAILTRTWIPIQDVPSNRITYSADVEVPVELLALMSAENPTEKNDTGKYSFKMEQAIPSYLISLAVGELEFIALDDICGVYAEPGLIEKAAKELSSIPQMVKAAENLYGEYLWGRYDVLFLPYSFPFGGMENPRLTFATPTIIAGDGSLVTLIAHELAHSWSGNLVTMANWDDFWLNEGFTVYFENRIMEETEGKEVADLLMLINYQELKWTVERMYEAGIEEETKLKIDLTGKDPDEGMTDIAYNKGAFFLMALENEVGRERWDEFLKTYFKEHAFQSITTEDFVAYLNKNLLEKVNSDFNINEWIYEAGLPETLLKIDSKRFKAAEKLAHDFKEGNQLPKELKRSDKVTYEWIAFIRAFEGKLDIEKMKTIDKQLNFSKSGNSEIMAEWFVLGIKNDYEEVRPDIEAFLSIVGRRKFLEPIYEALRDYSPESKKWGLEVYEKVRNNYHPISYNTIDYMLY